MDNKLNIALIGCGRVAGHHARSIAKIPELARLVAVCDLVEERGNDVANTYHIDAFNNYFEMLNQHLS